MATGVVKFFKDDKGFGFISPDAKEGSLKSTDVKPKDVFFHVTGIKDGKKLAQDQKVEYDIVESDKGPKAINIRSI